MESDRELCMTHRIQGYLFRLRDGREIAIYLRDGVSSIAELRDGRGELHSGAWLGILGRKLAHAERRGEVEVVSPIPAEIAERIEALHLCAERFGARHTMRRIVLRISRLAPRYLMPRQKFFGRMSASSAEAAE
jgi:predicted LPLAT superfamily acyltransferase